MKISKLFHYLYAIVLLLPVMVAPAFWIYSHRHTIDSYSVVVPQNALVEMKQNVINGKPNSNLSNWGAYSSAFIEYRQNSVECAFEDEGDSIYAQTQTIQLTNRLVSNVFYLSFYCVQDDLNTLFSLFIDTEDGIEIIIFEDVAFTNQLTKYDYIFTFLGDNNGVNSLLDPIILFNASTFFSETYLNISNLQLFNLTQMYGSGNEPTIEQFTNTWTQEYYSVDSTAKTLVKNVSTVTYDDTDIGSQFLYCSYNTINDYFNFNNISFFNGIYDWIQLNFFNGNAPLGFFLVWSYLVYWLFVSIFWLLFDVFMYVPQLAHRWIDKARIE